MTMDEFAGALGLGSKEQWQFIAFMAVIVAMGLAPSVVRRKTSVRPRAALEDGRVAALREKLHRSQTYCWYLAGAGGRRRSHLGGLPYMRADRTWPRCDGRPLNFVAQINLADLALKDGPAWLPGGGPLLFFADLEADAWAVIHEADTTALRRTEAPADLPPISGSVVGHVEKPVYFRRARSWPSWERLKTPASDDEIEAARASLRIAQPPEPTHQIGGFPSCIQGDWMEWRIEMDARGIRPKDFAAWLETPEAAALEPEVRQWRLLLQIDSDPDTGFEWADVGTLYFWIREADARAGDFSHVRMVVQFG